MKKIIIYLIYSYRWLISPLFPPRCRFEPTCSRYAIQAIEIHGVVKGLRMTFKRLLRCHPYESLSRRLGKSWGYDPVSPSVPANQQEVSVLKVKH